MPRRSRRFHSGIQTLPKELLMEICLQLAFSELANLRQSSKAWKRFIDTSVLRTLLAREGIDIDQYKSINDLIQPSRLEETVLSKQSDGHQYAELQGQGFSDRELTSFWTLLGAKLRRSRGIPLQEGATINPNTPVLREYSCSAAWSSYGSDGAFLARIDHLDRILIVSDRSTGKFKTVCLDTGAVLWESPTAYDPSFLEYSEGYLLTGGSNSFYGVIQIWRLDRICPVRRGSPQRGLLHKHGRFTCGRLADYRFSFPTLVILTLDNRLLVYDIPNEKETHEINVTSSVEPPGQAKQWEPLAVHFNNEHYFTLFKTPIEYRNSASNSTAEKKAETRPKWCLQIFSRETGKLVWCLDTTSSEVLPKQYQCKFKETWTYSPRWDGPQSTSLLDQDPAWPIKGSPVGLELDPKTDSLLVLWGDHLAILSDYKKIWQQDSKKPSQPVILTFLPKSDDWDDPLRSLTVGTFGTTSLVCFNHGEAKILIDLPKLLSGNVEASIARVLLPHTDHYMSERLMSSCSSIQVDSTSLVLQMEDGCDVRPPVPWHDDRSEGACSCCIDDGHSRHMADLMGEHDEDDYQQRSIVVVFNWAEKQSSERTSEASSSKTKEEEQPSVLKLPANEPRPVRTSKQKRRGGW